MADGDLLAQFDAIHGIKAAPSGTPDLLAAFDKSLIKPYGPDNPPPGAMEVQPPQPSVMDKLGDLAANVLQSQITQTILDNPVTRGVAQGGTALGEGANELLDRAVLRPAQYGGNKLGLDNGISDAFRQNAIDPLAAQNQQLAPAPDAGLGTKLVQGASALIPQLAGALALGGETKAADVASRAPAAIQSLGDMIAQAVKSPAARVAGTAGATQAGSQAADMDASGHPVSDAQLGDMLLANTAGNMLPMGHTLPWLARPVVGAASGLGGQFLSNLASGHDGTPGEYAQAAALAGLLGAATPGERAGAPTKTVPAADTAAHPPSAQAPPGRPTDLGAVVTALDKAGLGDEARAALAAEAQPKPATPEPAAPASQATRSALSERDQRTFDHLQQQAIDADREASAAGSRGEDATRYQQAADSFRAQADRVGARARPEPATPTAKTPEPTQILPGEHDATAIEYDRPRTPEEMAPPPEPEPKRQYRVLQTPEGKPFTDSQGRPLREPVLDLSRDHLIHWLGINGGINLESLRRSADVDPALTKDPAVMAPFGRVGWPALRRNGGMSVDQALERLQQDGWLAGEDPNAPPKMGHDDATRLILDALNGHEVFHPSEGADERMQRRFQEQQNDQAADITPEDWQDMDEAAKADALLGLREHGATLANTSEGDGLTLAQWYARASEAGVPDEVLAGVSGTHAERAAQLARLTKDASHDTAGNGFDRASGDRDAQEGPASQAVAEKEKPYQLAAQRGSDQAPRKQVTSGDLFRGPTTAERIAAAREARDSERNGLNRSSQPFISTDLGATPHGEAPEQARVPDKPDQNENAGGVSRIESSSRDMFTTYRDRGEAHGQDQAGNGRQDRDSGPTGAEGLDQSPGGRRSDTSPALERRGEQAVDAIVRRFGGSVLADSIARDFREHDTAQLIGSTIGSPKDLAALASVYRNPIFETLHYIFVDGEGRVVAESAVSSRLPSSSMPFPRGESQEWIRRIAQQSGAKGVWPLHNHPSGIPTPSGADVAFTRNLRHVLPPGVELLGHVVIDHTTFGHITPDGHVTMGEIHREGADPLVRKRGQAAPMLGRQLLNPDAVALAGRALADLTPENSVALIVIDAHGNATLVTAMHADALNELGAADNLADIAKAGRGHTLHMVASQATAKRYDPLFERLQNQGLVSDIAVNMPDGSTTTYGKMSGHVGSAIGRKFNETATDNARQVFEPTNEYQGPEHDATMGRGFSSPAIDVPEPKAEPKAELPPRAPGETQPAYHARIMRENRESMKDGLLRTVGIEPKSAEAKAMRDVGRGGLRAMWAKTQRAGDRAAAAFRQAMAVFDKAGKDANLRAIDQWENQQEVTSAPHRLFFKAMDKAFNDRIDAIHEIAPDKLQHVIENYFPHLWEDPTRAAKWYQQMAAKRPLEGNKSFLKQRIHATIKDGMAAGLKPISTNPVDLVLAKMAQMDKFIALHQFRQDLQQRGWLKEMEAGERVPYGYARIDDPAFMKAAGLQGYFAVPELIARDVNNYLGPSLYRFKGFKALRKIENLIMMARLGWSAFHAGFTTLDNLVMHADVGLRYMLQGDVKRSLTTLAKTPLSVVWSPFEGGKLNRQWLGLDKADVHTAALLDALERGGARWKMSSTDYNNDLPKFIRSLRQRDYGTSVKTSLSAAGEVGSWLIHHKLVPNQKMAARLLLAKFALDRVAGKLGKERGDYAGIIEAMHPDALKQIMGRVVNDVDDRLGQMTYDNQFWNKTARELAQTAIGAVGWQVGTVRTVTGGVRDIRRLWSPEKLLSPLDKGGKITDADMGRISGRLTYLISLALLSGGSSAVLQYALTGQGPSEVKDYFFPKTGRKNPDGSDERLQFPSYWMDHYKLATHPLQTAEHKLHPILSMFMEAIGNQDYYGVEIRDPHAAWYKQAEQVGEYVAKGFMPYSWTNSRKAASNEAGIGRQAASFVGITNAPASVSRSKFQAFVAHNGNKGFGHEKRTQADAEHSRMIHDLEDQIRNGAKPDLSDLSRRDLLRVRRETRVDVPEIQFKKMAIEDKLDAWDMATPKERKEYHLRRDILTSKGTQTDRFRRLPRDERHAILERIREIRAGG